jgi:hypothetical protein
MTLVTFLESGSLWLPGASLTAVAGGVLKVEEAEMGGGFGQQTGWIQLGDLAIAFVFPVRLAETEEPESKQAA